MEKNLNDKFYPFALLLVLFLNGCASKTEDTKLVTNENDQIIERKFLHVQSKVDYENTLTKLYLIHKKNKIDSILINEAYGIPKISFDDNYVVAVLPTKGGIGMKREETYIYKLLKNQLVLVTRYTNFEEFSDNLFRMEYYKDSCGHYWEDDKIYIKGVNIIDKDTNYYDSLIPTS